jgi:hypothetical protein
MAIFAASFFPIWEGLKVKQNNGTKKKIYPR